MLAVESYVKDISHKVDDLQRQSHDHHQTIQERVAQESTTRMHEEHSKLQSEVIAWVSRIDHHSNLTSALRHVLASNSAGDWYLQSKVFRDWQELEEHSGLLLTGSCM